MRRSAPAAAALAAAALFLVPGAAGAATARAVGTAVSPGVTPSVTLEFTAAPGEANRLTLSPPPGTVGDVELRDSAVLITPGAGCERVDDHAVVCSPRRLIGPTGPAPAGFAGIGVRLGDVADEAILQGGVAAQLRGEGGDDTLRGSTRADLIAGGSGRDTLDGGDGRDVFSEDDESAPDEIDGGLGGDRVEYTRRRRAVTVDLGRSRGADGDQLRRVEEVSGGRGADRITGGPGPNTLAGGGGNDVLLGAGGPDRLVGDAGGDLLSGGTGRDTLDVREAGRAQSDRARGGSGVDVAFRPTPVDQLSRDCERVQLEGAQPSGYSVLVSQPLRAQRSGAVEVRLAVPRARPRFRGRVSLSYRGVLLGRPSASVSLPAGRSVTAQVGLVGPALSRLRAARRLAVVLTVNDAAFTTVLRAPLAPPSGTGGTPS